MVETNQMEDERYRSLVEGLEQQLDGALLRVKHDRGTLEARVDDKEAGLVLVGARNHKYVIAVRVSRRWSNGDNGYEVSSITIGDNYMERDGRSYGSNHSQRISTEVSEALKLVLGKGLHSHNGPFFDNPQYTRHFDDTTQFGKNYFVVNTGDNSVTVRFAYSKPQRGHPVFTKEKIAEAVGVITNIMYGNYVPGEKKDKPVDASPKHLSTA